MVATWNTAADAAYYVQQTAYYLDSREPTGVWYAPTSVFAADGSEVDRSGFERLFAGRDEAGRSLHSGAGAKQLRTPAFDITFSAPRSVSLAWALGKATSRAAIEAAQFKAVRATLVMLEREAAYARRGRGGSRLEPVSLTVATFQHGESRPADHSDGKRFADPNLHTHAVVVNIAARADGTVGTLHSVVLRNAKLSAGALYHAALAAELQALGFELEETGKNGTFEIAGVARDVISYFSARRAEIEEELREAGATSSTAVALAAAISRSTRSAKLIRAEPREAVWQTAAADIGFDVAPIFTRQREHGSKIDRDAGERLLAKRLAALPQVLTQTRSITDRCELVRSVAEAFVGTGIGAERVEPVVAELIEIGQIVELGQDALGLPRYSTPEMMRIEREVVAMAGRLVRDHRDSLDPNLVRSRCLAYGLSAEQTDAALAATGRERLAVVQGAPGTGKTTTLSPVVEAWMEAGYRVVGTASAWKVANMLRDDLKIEARAAASWLRRNELGMPFLNERSILIVDEAGLLSSRDTHALISAVDRAGARIIAVGDLGQLQSIGAGSGLKLLARTTQSAHVTAIVRQRETWARSAVTAFGRGDAATGLQLFQSRDLLVEADGPQAAIRGVVDAVEADIVQGSPGCALIIAKTNAEVNAIGLEVRRRMRERGLTAGADVLVDAVTPSGHHTGIAVASGDRVRFLTRNDGIGVVNGSTATVTRVRPVAFTESESEQPKHAFIEAMSEGRLISFDTRDLADDRGRARISWGYATTIYGAQGATVDRAAVLVSAAFDRHDVYVAVSRARETTTLVVDRRTLDRQIGTQGCAVASHIRPFSGDPEQVVVGSAAWLAFLSARLSRANVKETTLDLVAMTEIIETKAEPSRQARHEADHVGNQLKSERQTSLIDTPTSIRSGRRPQRRRELDHEL